MLPLSRTKKLLTVAAFLTLAAAAALIFSYSYIQGKITEAAELKRELALEQEKEERLRETEDIVQKTSAQRQALNSFFVGENDVAEFINEVEALGSTAGVGLEITSVNVSPRGSNQERSGSADAATTTPADPLELLTLDVAASGSWPQVFHFLQMLESAPKIQQIAGVTFSRESGQEGTEWVGRFDIEVLKHTD